MTLWIKGWDKRYKYLDIPDRELYETTLTRLASDMDGWVYLMSSFLELCSFYTHLYTFYFYMYIFGMIFMDID